MKKIFLLLALFATVFVACSDDDDEDDKGTPWEIKMTIEIEENNVRFAADIKNPKNGREIAVETINWGDGSINENLERLEHYYDAGTYTITIKGRGKITLNCGRNYITALDVTQCPALIYLYCDENELTSLNLSKCTELYFLSCRENQLTSLDISKCTELTYLFCFGNQLTSLDVSKCIELNSLECGANNFDDEAMNVIYNGLPDRTGKDAGTIHCEAKGNTTIALNKNWKIEYRE